MRPNRFVKIITSIIAVTLLLAMLTWLIVGVVIPIIVPFVLGTTNRDTAAVPASTTQKNQRDADSSQTKQSISSQNKEVDQTGEPKSQPQPSQSVSPGAGQTTTSPKSLDQIQESDSSSTFPLDSNTDQNNKNEPFSVNNRGPYDDFVGAYTI